MNDATWFWQIVDARGLADVSSDEFVALNELISKAARATTAESERDELLREKERLGCAMNALKAVRPVIAGLISAEYNVETWGLKGRMAAIDAAMTPNHVCEVCGGDCSAANPPPTYCPDRDGSGPNLADAHSKSPAPSSQPERIAVLCPHAPTYDAGLCCGHPDDCTFVSPAALAPLGEE